MPTVKNRINTTGVKALYKRLRDDEAFRKESSSQMRKDLGEFVKANFDLTPRQQEEIQKNAPSAGKDHGRRHTSRARKEG